MRSYQRGTEADCTSVSFGGTGLQIQTTCFRITMALVDIDPSTSSILPFKATFTYKDNLLTLFCQWRFVYFGRLEVIPTSWYL